MGNRTQLNFIDKEIPCKFIPNLHELPKPQITTWNKIGEDYLVFWIYCRCIVLWINSGYTFLKCIINGFIGVIPGN